MWFRGQLACLVVGLASGVSGVGAADWLERGSQRTEVRTFVRSPSGPSSAGALHDVRHPIPISLEPVALVSDGGETFLQVEARHDVPQAGHWVLNSLGVYDDQGREYVP